MSVKFSVMTSPFEEWRKTEKCGHGRVAKILKNCGGQGLEVFANWFFTPSGEPDKAEISYFRAISDTLELPIVAVDIICDLVASKSNPIEPELKKLESGIVVASKLGARIALVVGHGSNTRNLVEPEKGRKMIAEGLMKKICLAKGFGITLTIEDFGYTPELLCKAEDLLQVINLCNSEVKLTFDTGNFAFAGEGPISAFDQLAPHIVHVHFKDWAAVPENTLGAIKTLNGASVIGCPMGEGLIPNAAVAKLLVQQGYNGWVSLESPLQSGDPKVVAGHDLPFLKYYFKTASQV